MCGEETLWSLFVARMSQARRKDGAGTRRGTCPSAGGGGGHALWLPSSPFLPCVRTPGGPPAGPCTARALYGHGRVVRPALSRRCLPTLPLCPRGGGGGGALFAAPYLHPPPLGGQRCVWGGGGRPCRLPSAARTSQARRKHGAGTRRGTCPSAGGGGLPCVTRHRPSYPAFALPVIPPLGLARRVLSTGTVVWSVPHSLAAASPPCRFVLGGGGGFSPPPTCIPHPWGGGGVCRGGGPCRLPSAARTSQARCKHGAGTRRGTCPSAGGGACRVLPVVAPPTLRAHPRGGGGVWGGGGLVVVPSLHACRRHDASTTQARGEALG